MNTILDTILILAGGDGDRFAPLSHKMAYRFNGRSLLLHIVEAISSYAKKTVVVVNAENRAAIETDLAGHTVTFVSQRENKGGMADAVLAAQRELGPQTLILNANDIVDFSIIPELVDKTLREQSSFGLLAKRVDEYFPLAYLKLKDERAVAIVEKPGADHMPSPYSALVVDFFPRVSELIACLKTSNAGDDQYERAKNALMHIKPATYVLYEKEWATIKYSWQVLAMQQFFFRKVSAQTIDPSAIIHKTAVIEGNVTVGKNVKIGAFVKIVGPCFIGNNVTVGDHTLIRESTIGDNSLVGSGCEVARSYLSDSVMLHRNYVGDSVLGAGVLMGAGAVTANYRFDKKTIQTPVKGSMVDSGNIKFGLIAGNNVKIGVNAVTYPGVKLAPNSRIIPGTVVTKDI